MENHIEYLIVYKTIVKTTKGGTLANNAILEKYDSYISKVSAVEICSHLKNNWQDRAAIAAILPYHTLSFLTSATTVAFIKADKRPPHLHKSKEKSTIIMRRGIKADIAH